MLFWVYSSRDLPVPLPVSFLVDPNRRANSILVLLGNTVCCWETTREGGVGVQREAKAGMRKESNDDERKVQCVVPARAKEETNNDRRIQVQTAKPRECATTTAGMARTRGEADFADGNFLIFT